MAFTRYQEPDIVQVLILLSFFFLLSSARWLSRTTLRAPILGPFIVGIVYGAPLANILDQRWQDTFIVLGYVGLLFITFEGGLSTECDLAWSNLTTSVAVAVVGTLTPIGFSFLLLHLGYGYGFVETFISAAALANTSASTIFAVMAATSKDIDLRRTRLESVLTSAAILDNIVALTLQKIIADLDLIDQQGLWQVVGRPIVACTCMSIIAPALTLCVFGPLYRRYLEPIKPLHNHRINIAIMVIGLCAFISIAAFSGGSILLGGYFAGLLFSRLSAHDCCPSSPEADERPDFRHSYVKFLKAGQDNVMEPLFFASIGFVLPFVGLWTNGTVWRGILYALLMAAAKMTSAVVVPFEAFLTKYTKRRRRRIAVNVSDTAQYMTASQQASVAAMLASVTTMRGELGLLILQVAYSETTYLSQDAFLTGVWAVLLNSIVGHFLVVIVAKWRGKVIASSEWGRSLGRPNGGST